MQTITVSIADANGARCSKFEHLLQGEQGIRVLANAATKQGDMTGNRRLAPRTDITVVEDMVARIRRLNPRVLLANMKQCTDADCEMLVTLRRECPETLVVLLADESLQQEDRVVQALARGARGYLNLDSDSPQISKIIQAIDRGEAWVPRKMLGKLMDQILHLCHGSSTGPHFDPAG